VAAFERGMRPMWAWSMVMILSRCCQPVDQVVLAGLV
jgi:hypothetical protein